VGSARYTLLTPRGAGAIAVVALTGEDRRVAASGWLRTRGGRPLALAELAVPRLCVLVLGGEAIDEVLAVDRPRLGTLELHLHGSEAVLMALERHAGPPAPAEPDPAERLLREALDPAQIALALEQLALPLGAFLADLARLEPSACAEAARAALSRTRRARAQAEPARLVICGAQNAGKSTLMNRLLWSQRVLAGAEPGLTRDPVEEPVALGGYPYLLVDTAGHGAIRDELDRRAVERAEHARRGSLRLVVVDGSLGPSAWDRELAGADALWIRNKADLPQAAWPDDLGPAVAASCLDRERAQGLRVEIGTALRALRGLPAAGPVGGPAALTREGELSLASFVPEQPHG
jgi:small GTP-binding protein